MDDVTVHFLTSPLNTMTPDKLFSNYVFGLKLTFFRTRFEKISFRGDISVTDRVKEI